MLFRGLLRRVFGRQRARDRAPALLRALSKARIPASEAAPAAAPADLTVAGGARLHAFVQPRQRPPDWIALSEAGGRDSHGAHIQADGAHALIRRDGLAESWPQGGVEARRRFGPRDLGAPRTFDWEPVDDSPASRAAAGALKGLQQANDRVLWLLRDPRTLQVEVAPHAEAGFLRCSCYRGGDVLDDPQVLAALCELGRALVDLADADREA